jgi:sugar lactone lactonase YvrE
MGMFTQILRDLEQIVFPDRDQHPIPTMDGALTPNDLLDAIAPVGEPLPDAEALICDKNGAVYVSAGRQVLKLSGDGFAERTVIAEFEGAAGGIAMHPDGRLLVCVAGHGLAAIHPARPEPKWLKSVASQPLLGLTDVVAAPDGTIFVAEGSAGRAPSDWRRDLMEKQRRGQIVSCGPAFEAPQIQKQGLQFPYGLALSDDGKSLWFTESWSHRLSRAPISGRTQGPTTAVIGNMPGYPGRLSRAKSGGFWLALFAVRTHLVEFVLREDEFRDEMMRTIPQDLWVSPALATTDHCHEPMQLGNVKALGIEKPWAPPRSYGLVARFGEDGDFLESLHSRRGGRHHGITAVAETPQGLVILSKGSGKILLDTTRGRA